MAAYAQFGPGFHPPPPTQFLSRSGLQMPPSLTTHVISGGVVSVGAGVDVGLGAVPGGGDGGAQSPVATTSSVHSTSPPLTVGRTESGGGIGCSSGNNSNSSGSGTITQCGGGGTPTPELVQSANETGICRSKALPPTEGSLAYPYQSCNTSISTATLQPSVSCCDNGRPVMTDPVSGQMICSCQYDPTRFTALSNYTRIQSAAGIGVYGTPYPSNEQNPYPSIGVESPSFYSSVTHPYALKDNTGGADVTPWTSGGLQTSASYYTYDPTFGAYGYGASYDLAARRKNATRESTATLKAWLNEHKKNPYPTKGEKIMLAIITKMTLTQVSTWFANARRRLKKENKMTWEPKNRTEEEDDTLVSDEEKDHDDNDAATTTATTTTTAAAVTGTGTATTKQPSNYSYDAKVPLSNGVGASGGADPAAIACVEASVGGSNACVVNSPAVPLNKYNTGTNSGGGDTTAAVPTEPEMASVMTSIQPKECYGLAYHIRDDHTVEAQTTAMPLYQRMDSYQSAESYHPIVQPLSNNWRTAGPYGPYMDWPRLHCQRSEHSPSGTSVVATISLQSTTTPAGMRSTAYAAALLPDRSSIEYHTAATNGSSVIKRELSETPMCGHSGNVPTLYPHPAEANDGDIGRKGLFCT